MCHLAGSFHVGTRKSAAQSFLDCVWGVFCKSDRTFFSTHWRVWSVWDVCSMLQLGNLNSLPQLRLQAVFHDWQQRFPFCLDVWD